MSLILVSNVDSYSIVVSHSPSGPVPVVANGGSSAEGVRAASVRADTTATRKKKAYFMLARLNPICTETPES